MITKKPIARLSAQETRLGITANRKKTAKLDSVFMQMHNGTRTGEGSFYQALQKIFYTADNKNKNKLVKAFPEFFGRSVPEFGIYPYRRKK